METNNLAPSAAARNLQGTPCRTLPKPALPTWGARACSVFHLCSILALGVTRLGTKRVPNECHDSPVPSYETEHNGTKRNIFFRTGPSAAIIEGKITHRPGLRPYVGRVLDSSATTWTFGSFSNTEGCSFTFADRLPAPTITQSSAITGSSM